MNEITIHIQMDGKESECLKLLRKMLKEETTINFQMKEDEEEMRNYPLEEIERCPECNRALVKAACGEHACIVKQKQKLPTTEQPRGRNPSSRVTEQ